MSNRFGLMIGIAAVGAAVVVFIVWNDKPAAATSSTVQTELSEAKQKHTNRVARPAAPTATKDFQAAVEAALREPNPAKRSLQFTAALRDWVNHDCNAALHYVQAMDRQQTEYTQGLLTVLESIVHTDPAHAVALASEMTETREQRVIFNVLFDSIARTDIRLAVTLLDQLAAGESHDMALRSLVAAWSQTDLTAALDWAKQRPDACDKSIALETALLPVTKSDPKQSIELAQRYLEGDALNRLLSSGLRELTAIDPSAAAEIIAKLPPGDLQRDTALNAVRSLAATDPAKAITWARTLPDDLQHLALNNVLDIWGKSDPNAAKDFINRLSAGADQNSAAAHLASIIATRNPIDALQSIQGLSPSARGAAEVSIASSWAKTDPAAAANWAATLDSDATAHGEALRSALSYWVLSDPAAAGQFVQTLPLADQQNAISSIAQAYAQNNAPEAIAWAQSMSSDESRSTALREVLTRWADNQPQEAATWVANEKGTLQSEHVRTVLSQWFTQDPASASDWARRLPGGAAQDSAFNFIAEVTTIQNPPAAAEWAQGIIAPGLRYTRLEEIAIAWLQRDRPAARDWLASVELPAETKNRLLQQ